MSKPNVDTSSLQQALEHLRSVVESIDNTEQRSSALQALHTVAEAFKQKQATEPAYEPDDGPISEEYLMMLKDYVKKNYPMTGEPKLVRSLFTD